MYKDGMETAFHEFGTTSGGLGEAAASGNLPPRSLAALAIPLSGAERCGRGLMFRTAVSVRRPPDMLPARGRPRLAADFAGGWAGLRRGARQAVAGLPSRLAGRRRKPTADGIQCGDGRSPGDEPAAERRRPTAGSGEER